jgi:alpha-mannosidase
VERKLDSNSISYYLDRHRMLMDVEVPPMGYRTYALHPRKRRYNPDPQPKGDRGLIAGPDGTLENKYVKVRINPNGTFDLTDKKRKRTIPGMHFFTDNGSTGDGHFVIMPKRDHVVTSLASQANVSLMENNPMRATWRIDLTLEVPAEVDEQGRNRSPYTVEVPVSTWVTLRRGARRLEMRTRIDNTARDHRLRVNFPTDIDTDTVDVESAFDVVNRSFQWKDTAENHEGHFPWQPMLHFVDVSEDKHGLAFMSKGLREYEVIDDARRTLAVPLVRAHRAYMRANKGPLHPEEIAKNRRQHAEGVHDVEYALYPHDGDWRKGDVLNESRDYITPWRIIEGTVRKGDLPVTQSCVTLSKSEHVHLGAFCRADNGEGYILRIWNSADEELSTKLRTTLDVKTVTKVKMNETTEVLSIEKKDDAWKVSLRPKEIATLLLKP